MNKFKYKKYDYSKIGIKPKLHFRYVVDELGYEPLKSIFNAENGDLAHILADEIKRGYAFRYSKSCEKRYDVNDIDFEWEIITPTGTYKSNETGS